MSRDPTRSFMGRGVIELPMEEVACFIKNIVHREQWDKHLVVGGAIHSVYEIYFQHNFCTEY